MKKQDILTILFALLPSYLCLFVESGWAITIEAFATLIGIMLVASLEDNDYYLRERLRLAWIIHILALCGIVAYFNA